MKLVSGWVSDVFYAKLNSANVINGKYGEIKLRKHKMKFSIDRVNKVKRLSTFRIIVSECLKYYVWLNTDYSSRWESNVSLMKEFISAEDPAAAFFDVAD